MRLLILIIFFPIFISAQSNFLKDPDIVWAAELEQDWVIDVPSLEVEWDLGITTLKIRRIQQNYIIDIPLYKYYQETGTSEIIHIQRKESGLSSPYLANLVYEAVLRNKLPIFRDAECRIPLDITGAGYLDTIVTFDPVTYREIISSVYEDIDPLNRIQAWRLRQILAYHRKSATWSTTVIAIAPLVHYIRNSDALVPLFWFRPDSDQKKLSSNHVIWAKQTRNVQEKTQLLLDSLTPIKVKDGFQNPVAHQLKVLKNNPKTSFYDGGNESSLSAAQRKSILGKLDTTVSYHPETYEEQIEIKNKEIDISRIQQLRLLQTWYWDERRHRLSICLDAVAPLVDVLDNMDNVKFRKPLFYRRARR